jgi:hypothetical protein
MGLRTTLPAAAAVIATALAGWLYLDNRKLEDEVAKLREADGPGLVATAGGGDPWLRPRVESASDRGDVPGRGLLSWRRFREPPPAADAAKPPSESRMERRARRTRELEGLLGRDPDETEDEYRSRILPMMELALARPRERVDDMRKAAEAAAGVTDDQRAKLDQEFGAIYDEVIQFTDTAVADGQLTPYGRNVKGMLQYAGGLGSILEGAEGRIGKILSSDQLRLMSESGFEWGEYLGLRAPWERLRPPPPRPGS